MFPPLFHYIVIQRGSVANNWFCCRWGIFRLTDPPGMQAVLKCQQTGLFHPHGEENVYTDALRPGHVFEAAGMGFEVVDLRPGF